MRKIVSIILAGVLVVSLFSGCEKVAPDVIENNGGFAVSDGKMVYYIDHSDLPYAGSIRRVSVDNLAVESELVFGGVAENLNLSKDGKIYFLSYDGIYLIDLKKEGVSPSWNKTKFVELDNIDWIPMVLSDDWLYFCKKSKVKDCFFEINRIDVNTLEIETLVDGSDCIVGLQGFSLVGNSLYYVAYDAEKRHGLMKMDIFDGTSSLVIETGKSENYVGLNEFHVTAEYIYCKSENGEVIKRFDLNGKKEEVIYTAKDNAVKVVFVDTDFIYFQEYRDESFYYRIKADGTGEREQIVEDRIDGSWYKTAFVAGKIFVHYHFSFDGNEDGRKNASYCFDRDGKNSFKLN